MSTSSNSSYQQYRRHSQQEEQESELSGKLSLIPLSLPFEREVFTLTQSQINPYQTIGSRSSPSRSISRPLTPQYDNNAQEDPRYLSEIREEFEDDDADDDDDLNDHEENGGERRNGNGKGKGRQQWELPKKLVNVLGLEKGTKGELS